uniref:Coiled-coil domain containing 117 n=2 Tax=Latimeria chalumnae TaxID=7897 RepID=H3BAG3_LATCH
MENQLEQAVGTTNPSVDGDVKENTSLTPAVSHDSHFCRKHKRGGDFNDTLSVKRRRLEEILPPSCRELTASSAVWQEQKVGYSQSPGSTDSQDTSGFAVPCVEEMEQSAGESLCEMARRQLQEIENRITVEDEDPVESDCFSNGPVLVMSDILKEELKKGFDDRITHEVVESLTRPCMELAVWKPTQIKYPDKLKEMAEKSKLEKEQSREVAVAGLTFENCGTQSNYRWNELISAIYNDQSTTGDAEEEMEL